MECNNKQMRKSIWRMTSMWAAYSGFILLLNYDTRFKFTIFTTFVIDKWWSTATWFSARCHLIKSFRVRFPVLPWDFSRHIYTVYMDYSLKVPEYEKLLGSLSQWRENPYLHSPSGREWETPFLTNIGEDWMNPGMRTLPLPSANNLLWRRMSR